MRPNRFRFRPLSAIPLFLVLANCERCDPAASPAYLADLDGGVYTAVRVVPSVGVGTVDVPVLLLNSYGAPISGGTVDVSVAGATAVAASTSVATDNWGYAEVQVATSGPEAFTVTPLSSSDGAEVEVAETCWSVSAGFPDLELMPSWPLDGVTDAAHLVTVSGGYVVAGANEVWFLPASEGVPPHSVLYLTDPILGIMATQVDADGVFDLLVYSAAEVVLLRGRASGGMSWGAGFGTQNGMSISAVSAEDINADQ